ncbi:NADH dehydrogenase [Azospirillum sp. TSH100]|uniref:NADH-quinone oxidoreductase subunit C n=1 Tax=Azospirillum sp. TSH100 TaxID=652764 RepID=UPI000D60F4D8|nr:NADH-quinone oxidoreductase subunit C [Azospirillum sp. TSH100]PWC90887.1 NADH dehydrogenase [Azospirillum sp. TSH100]QCG90753.1 NADH-quinone oxidoreductase subunit C [Azospirillum sp. TSH100]
MSADSSLRRLTEALQAIPGVRSVTDDNGALWADAPLLDVEAMAATMADLGIRLGTVTAIPHAGDGEATVIYHYIDEHRVISVKTCTRNGALPSLAPTVRAASWAEREIRDLFAVEFPGHPNPVPLIRPDGIDTATLREAMCRPAAVARKPVSPLASPQSSNPVRS